FSQASRGSVMKLPPPPIPALLKTRFKRSVACWDTTSSRKASTWRSWDTSHRWVVIRVPDGALAPARDAVSARPGGLTSQVATEAPMSFVRGMVDDERGFTDELWGTMAGLGWLGLLVPEARGGLGLGMLELTVVQEEMGRAVFPGPYLSSAVLATLAALALGATELLAPLAGGERRGTVALEELGHGDPL